MSEQKAKAPVLAREMRLNRNHVLSTTSGHSIKFTKGVPVRVPPVVYADALNIGAEFVDGEAAIQETPEKPSEPNDKVSRDSAILAAIERVMDKNDRKDFTGAGIPKETAVSREYGFQVEMGEIKKYMQVYYDRKAAAEQGE